MASARILAEKVAAPLQSYLGRIVDAINRQTSSGNPPARTIAPMISPRRVAPPPTPSGGVPLPGPSAPPPAALPTPGRPTPYGPPRHWERPPLGEQPQPRFSRPPLGDTPPPVIEAPAAAPPLSPAGPSWANRAMNSIRRHPLITGATAVGVPAASGMAYHHLTTPPGSPLTPQSNAPVPADAPAAVKQTPPPAGLNRAKPMGRTAPAATANTTPPADPASAGAPVGAENPAGAGAARGQTHWPAVGDKALDFLKSYGLPIAGGIGGLGLLAHLLSNNNSSSEDDEEDTPPRRKRAAQAPYGGHLGLGQVLQAWQSAPRADAGPIGAVLNHFVTEHPFVTGFLLKCAEDNRPDAVIARDIAVAKRAAPAFARVFEKAGFVHA